VITPALGTLSAANYDFTTFNNGTLAINPVTATVKADNKSKPYGDLNPALTATVTGTVNGDVLNYTLSTTALQFSNVSNYPITANLGSNPNYDVTPTDGTLTVNKKAISHTIGNDSHDYGSTANLAADLGATFLTGVNGENLAIAYSSTGNTTTSNVGTYAITGVVSDGTGLLSNYDVTLTNGTLTVNKAHLTVTADDKTKIYDGAVYSPFTATLSGFKNGETDSGLRGVMALTGAAGFGPTTTTTAFLPGTYTITPIVGTLSATNYDFTPFVNGTLKITYGTCSGSQAGGVILPPINSDGTSVYPRKGGSTIPVKFTVCDANGNPISNPAAVFGPNPGASITLVSAVRGTVDNVNEIGDTIDVASNAFRYSDGQWIFNMATSNLTATTTYTFRINLAYGPGIVFKVGVK